MAVKESLRNGTGGKETKREQMRAQGHMPPRAKYESGDNTGTGKQESSKYGDGPDGLHQEHSDNWQQMDLFSGIVDRKGRVQFATEEPMKALGYTEDDLIGKPFWESSWFRRSQTSQDLVKECLLGALGGDSLECRVDTYNKGGDASPVTFIMSPMKGKDGGIVSIVAHLGLAKHEVESSASDEDLELIKEASDRLVSVFELTQEGYFETDATGNLTLASPHCVEVLGYGSSEAMVGRSASDYWVDAIDKSKVFELLEERGKVESHETALLNRNGSEVPVEVSARTVTDDAGVVVGNRFIFTDISEKKSWAQKLMDDSAAGESGKADLADVELAWAPWMDESDDGIGVVQDGMVVFANPALAEMAGYDSVAGLEGREVPEVFSTKSASGKSSVEDWATGGIFRSPLNLGLVMCGGKVVTVETSIIPGPHEGTTYSIVVVREVEDKGHVGGDLDEGQARFAALWSNPLQMAFVNDLKGRFTEANEATLNLLGYTLDEISSLSYSDVIHENDMATCFETLSQAASGAEIEPHEVCILSKSGEHIWIEFMLFPLHSDGKVHAVMGVAQDITERKRAEDAFRGLEKSYQAIFGNPLQMVFINDTQGNIIDVNDCVIDSTGYSREDLRELGYAGIIHNEDLSIVIDHVASAVSGGSNPNIEVRVLTKSGEHIWIESTLIPLEQDEGDYVIISFAQDVSERKNAEEALRESQKRYQAIFNNPLQMVFVTDASGKISEANDYMVERVGYNQGELGHLGYEGIIDQEDSTTCLSYLTRTASGQRTSGIEARMISKSGEVVWIESTLIPIEMGDEVYGVLGFAQDITERKRAENRLVESEDGLRAILENMKDAYFRADMSGNVVMGNPRAADLGGVASVEDLVGMSMTKFMGSEKLAELLDLLVTDGNVDGFEFTVQKDRLTEVPLDLNARVVFDSMGEYLGFEGTAREVSEHKHVEETSAEIDHRYQAILNNPLQMIIITDLDGQVTDINDSGIELIGYTTDEIKTMGVRDMAYPDDLKKTSEEFKKALRGKNSTPVEVRIAAKSGEIHWIRSTFMPLREDGEVYAVMGFAQDITQHKNAQQETIASERRFRSLFEAIQDIYFRLDPKTFTILQVNPAGVRGLGFESEDEVIGKSLLDMFQNPEDLSVLIDGVSKSVESGKSMPTVEAVCKLQDGRELMVEVTPHFTFNEAGEIVEVDGIIRDVTEHRQAEIDLRVSEERLKEMVDKLKVSQVDMSVPVIQAWDRILALPLIGLIDNARAQHIMEVTLHKIVNTQSQVLILDVTGVGSLDTNVTDHLLKMIRAVRFLGAKCAITGVSPEVAQTMLGLGIDTKGLVIKRDMQDGLKWGFNRVAHWGR